MTSIGDSAFSFCSSLKYISIPKSVICLNGNPFAAWDGKLECLSPNFVYEDDVLFNKDKSRIISFRNQNIKSYVIPSSVTSIGDSAFSWCSSLSELVIPSSVTSIGDSAFTCSSLSELVIPSSVTSIGDSAFTCSSLSELVIPSSVTSIGDWAFFGCSSLKYISIPKSVICLNGNPFAAWDGKLECLSPNFVYEDDVLFNKDKSRIISFRNQNIKSYVIPSYVTSIGDHAFSSCRSLSEIVIPSSVTSIGKGAFSCWDSLSEIVIPSSVTGIGDHAFFDCCSLSEIVIPSSVTSIGKYAFSSCRSLSEIVIPSSVTSIGDSAFYNCKFTDNLKQELISRFGDKIFSLW